VKPEILQAIRGRRKAANMNTILVATRAYPEHNADDAYFAEWVGDDIDALIAEVERLQVAWSAEHDAYIRADEQARMAKRDADELRGEVRELQNRLSAADPDIVWID
jgi:hypothetical protein